MQPGKYVAVMQDYMTTDFHGMPMNKGRMLEGSISLWRVVSDAGLVKGYRRFLYIRRAETQGSMWFTIADSTLRSVKEEIEHATRL